jgi:hypothetical protein
MFTLEFWLRQIPELKIVLCIDHPLHAPSLEHWHQSHEALLRYPLDDRLIVTHRESYTHDAASELKRLTDWLGVPVTAAQIQAATEQPLPEQSKLESPVQAMPPVIEDYYQLLIAYAGSVYAKTQERQKTPLQLMIERIQTMEYQRTQLQETQAKLKSLKNTHKALQQAHTTIQRSLVVRLIGNPIWYLRRLFFREGTAAYGRYRAFRHGLRHEEGTQSPPLSITPPMVRENKQLKQSLEPHDTVICTIVSNNYIAQARGLMRSIHDLHDDRLHLVVLIVDEPHERLDLRDDPFEVIYAHEIGIPHWRHFSFKYSIMELNTAVKPYLLEFLFQRYDAQRVIYFDPDIIVYKRLDHLLTLLDAHGVVLTPHLLQPLPDDGHHPHDLDILRAGVYNLGFFAISRQTAWRPLLRWWQDKLYTKCIVAHERGLFVDQSWMSLLPGIFPNVYVLREPGYNVAYWNMPERDVTSDDATYSVNGASLIFFHFSGYSLDHPDRVSKYQTRYVMSDLSEAYQHLFADYADRLSANQFGATSDLPYAYAQFPDGAEITSPMRRLLLEADPLGDRWPDPYDINYPGCFRAWMLQPDSPELTSRLAMAYYAQRPDLQQRFPQVPGADSAAYNRWFLTEIEEINPQ